MDGDGAQSDVFRVSMNELTSSTSMRPLITYNPIVSSTLKQIKLFDQISKEETQLPAAVARLF